MTSDTIIVRCAVCDLRFHFHFGGFYFSHPFWLMKMDWPAATAYLFSSNGVSSVFVIWAKPDRTSNSGHTTAKVSNSSSSINAPWPMYIIYLLAACDTIFAMERRREEIFLFSLLLSLVLDHCVRQQSKSYVRIAIVNCPVSSTSLLVCVCVCVALEWEKNQVKTRKYSQIWNENNSNAMQWITYNLQLTYARDRCAVNGRILFVSQMADNMSGIHRLLPFRRRRWNTQTHTTHTAVRLS